MKTIKKLSLLPLFVVFLVGCDAFGDLLTFTIKNVEMTDDIDITVNTPAMVAQGAPAAAVPFSNSGKVQISQVEELEEYLDNIKGITLNSIYIKLTGISSGTVQSVKLTINPLNIYKEYTNITFGEDFNTNFTDEEFKAIANSLLTNKELEYVISGIVNSTPVTFKVTIKVNANFKVKVLKGQE